ALERQNIEPAFPVQKLDEPGARLEGGPNAVQFLAEKHDAGLADRLANWLQVREILIGRIDRAYRRQVLFQPGNACGFFILARLALAAPRHARDCQHQSNPTKNARHGFSPSICGVVIGRAHSQTRHFCRLKMNWEAARPTSSQLSSPSLFNPALRLSFPS